VAFIDDILVYSKDKEERAQHLQIVLQTLQEHQLYAILKKYEFWLQEIVFLRRLISKAGIKVNP